MPAQSIRPSDTRSRLGRGLAALLGDAGNAEASLAVSHGVTQVPIEFLRPNAKNPRRRFDDTDLNDLADSIKLRGIIQPILVRPISDVDDAFEIIAGERRWRAAQQAGLHSVPVLVLNAGDRDALELAIIENVQRTDLNALEEAAAYCRLGVEFGYNHNDIARVIGKSRSHVANTMRLINLPPHTRELLLSGAISAGHGRALLSVEDPDTVAEKIVTSGLTVRDVEDLGRNTRNRNKSREEREKDSDLETVESKIALTLGVLVEIRKVSKGYDLRIRLDSMEQLNSICDKLLAT
jgi:ParB family transcriptional regulator, chromosome partitioning protein